MEAAWLRRSKERMLRMSIPVLLALALQPAIAQRVMMPEPMLELRERMATVRPAPATRLAAGRLKTATVDTSSEAYRLLDAAYTALREEDLDRAVENFEKAIPLQPERTDIRKDLAYTYLRIGENELGRRQFEKVVELDAKDYRSQLELAFLDYDTGLTGLKAKARELFVAVARDGDAEAQSTARGAVSFIDASTAIAIAPFIRAVQLNPGDFFSQFRLAALREERNEYEAALVGYRLSRPGGSTVADMSEGRVLIRLNRKQEALVALARAAAATDNFFWAEEARELAATLENR